MCKIISFGSIACIIFILKHYIENGIPCDELAGMYLITYIDGTHAPIVNILIFYVIKLKIRTNYVTKDY